MSARSRAEEHVVDLRLLSSLLDFRKTHSGGMCLQRDATAIVCREGQLHLLSTAWQKMIQTEKKCQGSQQFIDWIERTGHEV